MYLSMTNPQWTSPGANGVGRAVSTRLPHIHSTTSFQASLKSEFNWQFSFFFFFVLYDGQTVKPVERMNCAVRLRSSTPPNSFLCSVVGLVHVCVLRAWNRGHCCRTWWLFSGPWPHWHSGVSPTLSFVCMCCLSLLWLLRSLNIVTCFDLWGYK